MENEFEEDLTKAEKRLRDRFVEEYLKDYDGVCAALRLGYAEAFAPQYAEKFLSESYTQRTLSRREDELGLKETDQHRRRVIASLYREANNRGHGSSHGARVAALSKLSAIFGLDAPVKTQQELTVTTPVQVYIPDNGRENYDAEQIAPEVHNG